MAGILRSRGWLGRLGRSEAAPGLVLIACAAAALALANSPLAQAWHDLFHHPLPWTPLPRLDTLHLWINDGLMAVFFFVVGLEIKREIIVGELADPQRRRLPVVAALAGMSVPALVYLAASRGDAALHAGWAIPAATDIAFAMGVLALIGKRVPPSVRLFLLTVAIVDDLGAVAVIAIFYTAGIVWAWLGIAAALFGAMVILNRSGIRASWPYIVLAIALWAAVLHSGVHATVAGVLAALTVPMALDRHGDSPLLRMEHALVAPNGFLIVPLFGLANAGVTLGGGSSLADPLPLAIAAGLFIGKQVGVFSAVVACERLGFAPRPAGTHLSHLWGMALLCGIGFTMSLFIAGLAFPTRPALGEEAKIGILAGSLLSAIAGALVLRFSPKPAD
ncbi:Na+/H+ antiporter NhaA [Novosphingobium sp. KCTC 2891]|uniref:Na+/H+ antiporter NhaA n=1 Tax=Novosphingobium sp. KCTC 2891 TaxID=2989730 RepID=UPI0022215C0C|nr:Na+/H+ antiporter NhaA [Novosphingobium sp. KCTC 2891]MCW1384035.1 Na+/H+ antiporter NhaA [Novosphingobium sp. KCTC 2891]